MTNRVNQQTYLWLKNKQKVSSLIGPNRSCKNYGLSGSLYEIGISGKMHLYWHCGKNCNSSYYNSLLFKMQLKSLKSEIAPNDPAIHNKH